MKKWLSTLLYIASAVLWYPASALVQKVIYLVYRFLYMENGQWDIHYQQMTALRNTSVNAVNILCAAAFLWYLISSLLILFSRRVSARHSAAGVFRQAAAVQITAVVLQAVVTAVALLGSLIGIMNLFAAVFTLPVFYLLCGTAGAVLWLEGVLRGIAGVACAKREGRLTGTEVLLHSVLQSIPVINIFDSIYSAQNKS